MMLLRHIFLLFLILSLTAPKVCFAVFTFLNPKEVKEQLDAMEESADDESKDETEKIVDVIEKDLAFPLVYSNNFNNLWKLITHFQRQTSSIYCFYPEIFTPPPKI